MSGPGQNRIPVASDTVAEVIFFVIILFMLSGPLSGLVLSIYNSIAGVLVKSAYQVESTKNLAAKLLVASNQIRTLEKRVAEDQLELTRLRQQAKDTERLRSLLALHQQSELRTIAADVITRDPDNWFQQVTIDKGHIDHIQLGSAVITAEGVVGQVVKVSEHSAVVRLVTDPDQKVGVLIERIGQAGILCGRNKGPAVISHVPVGTAVDVGDKIVTLGHGGIFPSGHKVGTVAGVRRDLNGTTLTIEVKLSENFFNLRQVLVVPPQIIQ